MPAQIDITLSAQEKKQLEKQVRSKTTPVRLVERSRIILLAAKNILNYKIAEELEIDANIDANDANIDANKVGRWRNRFFERGLKGIEKDLPRGANHGGKNSVDQAKLRSKVIKITTQEKPKDGTHWTTRGLAKVMGINHSFINRVWREVGLKPHLVARFKVSSDPAFEDKLRDVVGLYVSPPENAVVFCVDEKSSIQALVITTGGFGEREG